MRRFVLWSTAMLALCWLGSAGAAPDRASLLAEWEARMAALESTQDFEKLADGEYRLVDTELPYDGELQVIGVMLRPSDPDLVAGYSSALGIVEIELTDLPESRRGTQSYYYWLNDRQVLYYVEDSASWVDAASYQQALVNTYSTDTTGGLVSVVQGGVWFLLILLLVLVFLFLGRQQKKAKRLMDDTAEINAMARDNIERSAELQDEVMSLTRQLCELQEDNNRLLGEIRDSLKR